jgi:hypothetical protein
MNTIYSMLLGIVLSAASTLAALPAVAADGPQKAIVLVHGGLWTALAGRASITS